MSDEPNKTPALVIQLGADEREILMDLAVHYLEANTEATNDDETINAVDALLRLGRTITRNFTSPNEMDSNFEPANVVDALIAIARAIEHVAIAIEGQKAQPPAPTRPREHSTAGNGHSRGGIPLKDLQI